jgi:hypothetical protein
MIPHPVTPVAADHQAGGGIPEGTLSRRRRWRNRRLWHLGESWQDRLYRAPSSPSAWLRRRSIVEQGALA